MLMRATWDERYSSYDIMRSLICMFLAVRAAYEGRLDLTKEWEDIAPLVKKLADRVPGPQDMPDASR